VTSEYAGSGFEERHAIERRRRAHVDRPSVEPRAAAARRYEQFALERVEHHRKFELSATLVGNRHAELRKAVRKVSGAVERIDNPSMRALPRVCTALFGEDRVIWEGTVVWLG
jgi:hypothetical protein